MDLTMCLQPLCMALKLVLTPIVSINAAIPFVCALRQQSAEAAEALLSSQRSHISLLDLPGFESRVMRVESSQCAVGGELLKRHLDAEHAALHDYVSHITDQLLVCYG